MKRYFGLSEYSVSPADLVRFLIMISLTFLCIIIATYSIARNLGTIYAQLFYFPIIYATYFYPRRGLYLAGGCAVLYECFAYLYIFPDTGGMIAVTGQALLFVCVGALVAYVSEKIMTSEVHSRTIVEKSPMGIILFDRNNYTIRLSNSRLEHMLGYSAEDLAGMTFQDLLSSDEDRQRFTMAVASGEEVHGFETFFLTREKEPVRVHLSWSRITEDLMSCTVVDINRVRLARMAADEIDTHYKQATDSLPTGIVIIRDKMIVYANPSFELLSGYTAEDLLGINPLTLIYPEDQVNFLHFCHLAQTGSSIPVRTDVSVLNKSGKILPVILFFTKIFQDKSPAVLVNLVDVPEPESTKGQPTQDNKRERGIISTFAYELRTPLQPIMGYINLLMQDPETYGVSEETRIILDRCAKSVDRERQIINQMLELSVIDTGKTSLDYSIFSVPDLITSIIEKGGYAADAVITMDVPKDLTFEADRNKISTVIDTMLSNAVKYSTHPRKIHIAYRSTPDDTMHRLSIRDNGIGITDARLDEIFEPFPIPESGKSLKFDKIGLSLAIAKKYIKMHGGYISVDSIINLETTFSIHIPKKRPEEVGHNNGT
jgi:PAS domain S-box-containing protein